MTRIFIQRGSAGSSSNANRPPSSSIPQTSGTQVAVNSAAKEEEQEKEPIQESGVLDVVEQPGNAEDENLPESLVEKELDESADKEILMVDENSSDAAALARDLSRVRVNEHLECDDSGLRSGIGSSQIVMGPSYPPPPPVPPQRPLSGSPGLRRMGSGSSFGVRIGSSRRPAAWPAALPSRSSPSGSRPSSPRSHAEAEGYNSSDEQGPCYVSSYDDVVSSVYCLIVVLLENTFAVKFSRFY